MTFLTDFAIKKGLSRARVLNEAVATYLQQQGYDAHYIADKDSNVLRVTKEEWSTDMLALYLATWVDTEGWLGLAKRKNKKVKSGFQFIPTLQITNLSKAPIMLIQQTFGGHVYLTRKNYHNQIHHYWTWSCRVEKLPIILKKVAPFLIVKRKQAEALLDYFSQFPNRHNNNQFKERFEYCDKLYANWSSLQ